jgi:CheY-like chemotaxis protein
MKTILQVEDDENDVFLLQHAMKKAGVTNAVQVVSDGQEAIDYLQGTGKFADREQFPFPEVVLLDLKLPYVMGLDVLKWIRTQPKIAMAVVMLTASGEDHDIASAYRLGANGYLIKPTESSKLVEIVKALRDFWLIHNTQPLESREKTALSRYAKSGVAGLDSARPWNVPAAGTPPAGHLETKLP